MWRACTGTITHSSALMLSCLKSRAGLIGSYRVSIELCARLQCAEQNSHRGPKSSSLCECERKTRGRGSGEDMKTTMWSWFISAKVQTRWGLDHEKGAFYVCVCAQVNNLVFASCVWNKGYVSVWSRSKYLLASNRKSSVAVTEEWRTVYCCYVYEANVQG